MEETPEREQLLAYVERLALVLDASGIPRMPARVFSYALADGAPTYTAAELADGLRVSTAAISGAVRYLVDVGLLTKGRKPGSRADHYAVDDKDLWGTFILRNQSFAAYHAIATEGVEILGRGSPGGRRMWETKAFFEFMMEEQNDLVRRWKERLARLEAPHDDA